MRINVMKMSSTVDTAQASSIRILSISFVVALYFPPVPPWQFNSQAWSSTKQAQSAASFSHSWYDFNNHLHCHHSPLRYCYHRQHYPLYCYRRRIGMSVGSSVRYGSIFSIIIWAPQLIRHRVRRSESLAFLLLLHCISPPLLFKLGSSSLTFHKASSRVVVASFSCWYSSS